MRLPNTPICHRCEWRPAVVKGLCGTCYQWRRRHKADRPEDAIVRHAQRVQERRMMAEAMGGRA